MRPEVEISIGALSPPIAEQLGQQGLQAAEEDVAKWQVIAKAIVLLAVHDVLTDSARTSAGRKLVKMISRGVRRVKW